MLVAHHGVTCEDEARNAEEVAISAIMVRNSGPYTRSLINAGARWPHPPAA